MSKNERRKNQPVEEGAIAEHPVTGGTPPAPDPSTTPRSHSPAKEAVDDEERPGIEPDDVR